MKKKILIFGSGGMLGKALIKACGERFDEVERRGYTHDHVSITDPATVQHVLERERPDVVINAAGAIVAHGKDSAKTVEMMQTNAVGPLILAAAARRLNIPMIHVSTDCVFGGMSAFPHAATDIPDPTDLYGMSKRAGEACVELGATVVRTSFIGREHGLYRWFSERPQGAAVQGWTRALWSGSSVRQVARTLIMQAVGDGFEAGKIEHLATRYPISKLDVLTMLATALDRKDIKIEPVDEPMINRALEPTIVLPPLISDLPPWE